MTKTRTRKRPPRQVWCVVNVRGELGGHYPTRKAARAATELGYSLEVAGPYVLAERTAHR